MYKHILSLIVVLVMVACANDDNFKTEVLFDDGWHFVRIEDTLSESDSLQYIQGNIPAGAEEVTLPHSAKIEPLVVNDQWQGTCFYFKTLNLTEEDIQKRLALRFDGAMNVSNVWVNGEHVKTHQGGYLPFEVEIEGRIRVGENKIVVCLDNRDNETTGPVPLPILDYNTYGGLYRHVWLIKNDRVMITRHTAGYSDAGVVFRTLKINDDYANVYVQIDVKNIGSTDCDMLLDIEILDADGIEVEQCQIDTTVSVGERATLSRVLEIDDVQLWSPREPNLYTLKVSVREGEELLDRYEKRVGIRKIKIEEGKVYVNGEETELKGCRREQEYPYIGYALSDKAQWRDVWKIKESGYNYVHLSHCPHSEAFIEGCDAYGVMVIEQIPGYRYFGGKAFEAQALQSAKDMIRRDRNNPSILAWELAIEATMMPKTFTEAVAPMRDREAPGTYTVGPYEREYDIRSGTLGEEQVMFDYNRGSSLDICGDGVFDIFRMGKTGEEKIDGEPSRVKVSRLEDGPHMPQAKEKKDTKIYYGELLDHEGNRVSGEEGRVRWTVTGNANIVNPDSGMVKTVEERATEGVSKIVVEEYGDFSIRAEYVDNE